MFWSFLSPTTKVFAWYFKKDWVRFQQHILQVIILSNYFLQHCKTTNVLKENNTKLRNCQITDDVLYIAFYLSLNDNIFNLMMVDI
jgi:hypothetical protein